MYPISRGGDVTAMAARPGFESGKQRNTYSTIIGKQISQKTNILNTEYDD